MQPFQLSLSNDGIVAGAHSLPLPSASSAEYRPLVVGLHGGCYDSKYFDATSKHSASLTSVALGVPFVSIDRPSYGTSSSILPIPAGSNFIQETGLWLHRYIFPKLWSEFGVPNQCNCIVLLCHSLGAMGGIVAAALHAQDKTPLYPLGGLIASGMGDKQSSFIKNATLSYSIIDPDHAIFPLDSKDSVMFKPGTVTTEVLNESERLNAVSPLPELAHFAVVWLPVWKDKWAAHVSTSVMFSLVEDDPFFEVNEDEISNCTRAFKNSVRVDGSLIRGAPHCLELSKWSQGWYARCFGFSIECSAGLACSC
jgi:pimeloyl-ACP methyl ester carboxylesterase